MRPESSPFTPGQPVPIEFFVGRVNEIERLRSLVRASISGKFRIAFVSGERGIGKSSLVSFVRHLSERDEGVASAHVFLGGVDTLTEMVRRIFDRLLKESVEKPWHKKIRDLFGQYVKQVGLFGITIELQLESPDLESLVNGFATALNKLLIQLKDQRKALLLILDDINGLAATQEFANWLKSTVDEIATSGNKFEVCLLIVGLEERRQQLIQHQPSLARVFEVIEIQPWSEEETRQFFSNAFEKAGVRLQKEALDAMTEYTGGLPVLAHEIGDAIWRIAEGPEITFDEAIKGVWNAAQIIGQKLLEPQVLSAIRSQRYRSILRKLAVRLQGQTFKRADLLKSVSEEEKKVCDNFLNRLRKLGVILPDKEAGPGAYRFSNQLHAVYFKIEAIRARQHRQY